MERRGGLALVAAATTWFTMLSWRGFSSEWGRFLGPLLLVALAVFLGGMAVRATHVNRRAGVFVHVMVVLVVVWLVLGGSPAHPLTTSSDIDLEIQHAWVSATRYTAPIPAAVPSIAPLMIVCGTAALLVVDVLACWLHRVPLAGLALLAVYCTPIVAFDGGVSWPVFLVAAVGFLLMMFFQQSAQFSRWGRPLGANTLADPTGFGVRAGASRASAGAVGGVAVMLAVMLPLFIPTPHLDGVKLFGARDGGGSVTFTNPIVTMRRDLHQGTPVPLLDVTTGNPDPSYLRLAVLDQFDGVEWTAGNRIRDQVGAGPLPLEEGLDGRVVLKHYRYTVTATSGFSSTWLPTQFPVSQIVAPGDWRYDPTTMDFFAGNPQTNTRGITYRMTAAVPQISATDLSHAPPAPMDIRAMYVPLPPSVPAKVYNLAVRATHGATNPYRKAVLLQSWFRNPHRFTYSLAAHPSDRDDALVRFLTPGHDGRVGYCEQFASAYAVMARAVGIPARVAVGFLQPTRRADGDWVYRSDALHAWPELYFQGSGWVRFEPTPASRAPDLPPWTTRSVKGLITNPGNGGPSTNATTDPTKRVTPSTTPGPIPGSTTQGASSGFSVPWAALGRTLGGLAVVTALTLVPGAVRRSRRARRVAGGAEDAWAELRDTAVDLRVDWPAGRSPRETGAQLAGWFGAAPDGPPAVQPTRGPGLDPDAERALDRIVLRLEQVRYARSANDVPGGLAGDVRTCIEALEHGCTRNTLSRARWLPRSVFRGAPKVGRIGEGEPAPATPGGVSDHVA
jgi:transglutaminase-like putative cysteine protease